LHPHAYFCGHIRIEAFDSRPKPKYID